MNPHPPPIIPDDAPFTAAQRAWLNGFLAGLYGGSSEQPAVPFAAASAEEAEFPWHDPALEIPERMQLAEGRPVEQRLMAALAQLDCGQCGYLCRTYSEAIAAGQEASLSLCVPGAKQTTRMLKQLLAETSAPVAAPIAAPPGPMRPALMPVRVLRADPLTKLGSAKDVRHVVIDLASSGLVYDPGDSIGLAAPNDPALVEACIAALGATGVEDICCPDGVARTLREAFAAHLDIARPLDRTLDLLAMTAVHPDHAAMLRRLGDGQDGAEPADADLLDLLDAFPSARPALTALAASLPALRPRLYSIASSLRATPGQVPLRQRGARSAAQSPPPRHRQRLPRRSRYNASRDRRSHSAQPFQTAG
jgi:sulfite reductase (NADPH) flavoprotein alpha-component